VCGKTARTVRRAGRAKPFPTPIIAASLLFKWRRALRGGASTPQDTAPAFVPVTVVPEAPPPPSASPASPGGGTDRLEIVLTNGRRVVVGSGADPAWLARVLHVAEGP